ncbi:hypothetical protein LIER_03874 [Lithospermum erythrorhizon]|uniref:Retroviral polymerase SH3-like domain-containing protein n=1 Tax=Lithospermum erythrorhizon TaxID=34254 RepID=A0AAV3NW71_LITER
MTMKELALRLRIKEDNKNTGVISALPNPYVGEVKANVVEQGSASKIRKGKRSKFAPRGPSFKRNGHDYRGPKTVEAIFIGYAHNSNAYQFLVHKSDNSRVHKNSILESRNAKFFEHVFPLKTSEEVRKPEGSVELETVSKSSQPKGIEDEDPRRSKRTRFKKIYGPDFVTFVLDNEPRTYSEVMSLTEAPHWKEAIRSEVEPILKSYLGVSGSTTWM